MPSDVTLIDVAVPVGVTGTFTYSVPLNLRSSVEVGSRVLVPWGTKVTTGFVVSFADTSVLPHGKIKPIREVLDDGPAALVRQVLELCIWAADYYIAPVGEMLKVALPANMASRGKTNVALVMSEEELRSHLKQMTKKQLEVVGVLQDGGGSAPMSAFSANRDALKKLIDAGVVATSESHRDRVGVRYDRFIILESPPPLLPTKQQAVIDLLTAAGGEASYADLIANGASGASISTLTRKGVVRVERRPRSHSMSSFVTAIHGETTFQHTPEQRNAIDRVTKAFGAFRPFLLQGVTGSGKTEVYIELLRRCMKRGEKAIVLVPEIGLTPAFASRLTREFGDRVAILHSSLSAGEKYDQWRRAREGEVDIAIGPRSALFSPFETVGLIIVDEEGDAAYKQEETPRYNARDLAVVRARLAAAPVVLGSATPSLESRNNAEEGKYELIRLTKRVEERPLPEV